MPAPRHGPKKHPELKLKLRDALRVQDLGTALQAVGASRRVLLMVSGTDASIPARRRLLYRLGVSARGRTLDEFMQAVTAATGDPWERWGTAHWLSFTGQPMTPVEKTKMVTALSSATFVQSPTPAQMRQIQSPEGLNVSQLSRPQQALLRTGLRRNPQVASTPADSLVLRRYSGPGPSGLAPLITVLRREPGGGLTRIAGIRAP